ncbi:hypothetical protein Bhyg_08886 [Pseudolycoriella hygida]|uniref:Uncharacterized protein n=1 Tax=Pseudolycoriella hygida TaxID=35572 RepID=A0A9Q0N5H1_9DIPT|nr:hypothetical protein Bhyg_08886 [Pseudolycoriella hygida]
MKYLPIFVLFAFVALALAEGNKEDDGKGNKDPNVAEKVVGKVDEVVQGLSGKLSEALKIFIQKLTAFIQRILGS